MATSEVREQSKSEELIETIDNCVCDCPAFVLPLAGSARWRKFRREIKFNEPCTLNFT